MFPTISTAASACPSRQTARQQSTLRRCTHAFRHSYNSAIVILVVLLSTASHVQARTSFLDRSVDIGRTHHVGSTLFLLPIVASTNDLSHTNSPLLFLFCAFQKNQQKNLRQHLPLSHRHSLLFRQSHQHLNQPLRNQRGSPLQIPHRAPLQIPHRAQLENHLQIHRNFLRDNRVQQ